MEQYFILNRNVELISDMEPTAVQYGIARMKRDIQMTLTETSEKGSTIRLIQEEMTEEAFHITFKDNTSMEIRAKDELGFIFALLYISKKYLKIQPFWFWNDQKITKIEQVRIPMEDETSIPAKVKFRGWFINDEVLIDHWDIEGDKEKPWEYEYMKRRWKIF